MKSNLNKKNSVFINNEQSEIELPDKFDSLEFINRVLNYLNLTIDYIEITYLDTETIKNLNNEYFKVNSETDTISFNLTPESDITGDIYLCPKVIKANSVEFNTGYINEFKTVIIHSILHLTGQTDTTEASYKDMKSKQEAILKALSNE